MSRKYPHWDDKDRRVWERIAILQQETAGNSLRLPFSRLPQVGDSPRQTRRVERDIMRLMKAARRVADAKQERIWICRIDDKNLLCTRQQMNVLSREGLPKDRVVEVKPAYERVRAEKKEAVDAETS